MHLHYRAMVGICGLTSFGTSRTVNPESVKDRPTRSHEYVFLLSKSEKYLYNHEVLKEPAARPGELRSKRTVWQINTEAYPEAHFATFPKTLVEPCVLGGSDEGDEVLDPFFGSGYNGGCVRYVKAEIYRD